MHLQWPANTSIKSNFLIIISHSARALSESASRAGWNVISVDGFADTDTLKTTIESWCLPLVAGEFVESHIQTCLVKLKQCYPQARVILGAGAENLAIHIEELSGWQLCSSNSQIVARLSNPNAFFAGLAELRIPYPSVQFGPRPNSGEWLFKLQDSCGGMGVRREYIDNVPGYWQQEISGLAVSALCLSDGQEFVCLGINQQYSTSSFEGYPYVYQGALANADIDSSIRIKTVCYIDKIIKHFNIIGMFSLDMILPKQSEEETLYVLEINPRVSASFELYERINPNLNLIDAHIRVCEGVRLSEIELSKTQSAYLIVYAKDDCQIAEDMVWPEWVKDRPECLRKICKHEPICSVHADAGEADDSLYSLLQHRAEKILNVIN
jgi:uncharacterized protein